MNLPILVAVFVATLSLLIGTYLFYNRQQLSAADAARARLKLSHDPKRAAPSILKDSNVDSLALLDRLFASRWLSISLTQLLLHAGSDVTPAVFVFFSIGFGSAGVVVGAALRSPIFAAAFAVAGALGPLLYFSRRAKRRLNAFQEQLPDSIDMLVSAMKAGYSFQAAMNFIGQEVHEPLGPEFARFYDEQRLGIDVRTALLSMLERVNSMDLKMFVTAVLVQRESGGNLAEVLANISDIMRERFAMEGEIKTLTAESKLSARILAGLPVVVFLGISAVNPTFMRPMWTQPVGQAMMILAGVSVVIGYFIMMRIADIDL